MRFNFNATTHEEAHNYLVNRAVQLLRFGYKLINIIDVEFGAIAIFSDEDNKFYQSIYLLEQHRNKGHYKNIVACHSYQILTSTECGISDWLIKRKFSFKCIKINDFQEYEIISKYYGDQKAERSGVYYMNHIDEGLHILNLINASEEAKKAYCLHPIYQANQDLETNIYRDFHYDSYIPAMLAMEYRHIANDYLSFHANKYPSDIKLSCLKDVNDMLIADKIQNYKDFMLYHFDTHKNSHRLEKYFYQWMTALKCLPIAEIYFESIAIPFNKEKIL